MILSTYYLAKAFDSVNHRFLFAKMKSFGLGDVVVRLIEAYISGRVSRVHVGGEHSRAIPMHSGVPRGLHDIVCKPVRQTSLLTATI